PETSGAPEASAMPRHSGKATRNTTMLAGKSWRRFLSGERLARTHEVEGGADNDVGSVMRTPDRARRGRAMRASVGSVGVSASPPTDASPGEGARGLSAPRAVRACHARGRRASNGLDPTDYRKLAASMPWRRMRS